MELTKEERVERRKNVRFRTMEDDADLAIAMELVAKDLSEPYSVFTYRSFVYESPHLCLLAVSNRESSKSIDVTPDFRFVTGKPRESEEAKGEEVVGVCISRVAARLKRSGEAGKKRGYIGMLAIRDDYRRMGLAQTMVAASIYSMVRVDHAQEIVLEVEGVNSSARRLYAGLGLTTDKLLPKYYLNGSDAYRMRLEIAAVTQPDDPAWDTEIRQVVPPGIAKFWDGDTLSEVAAAAGRAGATAAAAKGKLTSNSFAGCLASKRKRAHLGEQLRARRIEKRVGKLEEIKDEEWTDIVKGLQEEAAASAAGEGAGTGSPAASDPAAPSAAGGGAAAPALAGKES